MTISFLTGRTGKPSLLFRDMGLVCIVVCCISIIYPAGIARAASMDISFQDDLISAELVDVPLIEVLQRISQEYGLKAHFHGDLNEPVTFSFKDLPLAKCLKLLTGKKHSLSIATVAGEGKSELHETKQVAEIWVLSGDTKSKPLRISPVSQVRTPAVVADTTGGSEDPDQPSEGPAEATDSQEQANLAPEEILSDPTSGRARQRQAIQSLAKNGDPASIMAMAGFLDNEDRELRQLLVNGISSINSEESTQVLGLVFQDEADQEIRKIALWALAKRKDDPSAQAVLRSAQSDPDEGVQSLAEQLLKQDN